MLERSKMFSENVDTIEEILVKYFDEPELNVKEILCEAGSKDGDNYMSLIKRIHVRYTRPGNKGESIEFVPAAKVRADPLHCSDIRGKAMYNSYDAL